MKQNNISHVDYQVVETLITIKKKKRILGKLRMVQMANGVKLVGIRKEGSAHLKKSKKEKKVEVDGCDETVTCVFLGV